MRPNILAPSVTPMASARTPTNGLKMLVAACMIALIDGALNTGSLVGHLLFNYTPKPGWSRVDGIEPLRHGDQPHPHTIAPCMSRRHANSEIKRATMYVTTASAAG